MKGRKKLINLNQLDFLHFAVDEMITAFTNLITVRFKTTHSVKEIRKAMRHMLTIYPRLRSVIVPTLFSYKLKIRNDDEIVDLFFSDAFKVRYNLKCGTEDYMDTRKALLNEPFSLLQGIPIKILYIPDDPSPVLLLSIHHTVCDGRSWIHLVGSIISYLNEKKPLPVPLDSPSLWPALLERPFYKIPVQLFKTLSLFWQNQKRLRGVRYVSATDRPVKYSSPCDLVQEKISIDLQKIIDKSKALECSVTVLLLSALTIVFNRRRRKPEENVVGILLSVDSRPFFEGKEPVFGNYSLVPMIRIHHTDCDEPDRLLDIVKNQIADITQGMQRKQILFPMMIDKLSTFVGRKNYARAAAYVKKKGQLEMTSAVSNLGNLDKLNTIGTKCQVCEAIATAPHPQGLFITFSGVAGELDTNFTFQTAEFTRDEIKTLMDEFENELSGILTI